MAFKIIKNIGATGTPMEHYFMTADEACHMGEALKIVSGKLTQCAATDVPEFISETERAAEAAPTKTVMVSRVTADVEYEADTAVTDFADTDISTKVTLAADALGVTDTTLDGVFFISKIVDGKPRGFFR